MKIFSGFIWFVGNQPVNGLLAKITTLNYGLGPVSVLPAYQRQGIGKALVVCLVGHADYYRKFGFKNMSGLVLEGGPREFFFALSFDGKEPLATVAFHEAFKADGQAKYLSSDTDI